MASADNSLVPFGGTSGQVDWLGLSKMPVTLSLEVAGRLANAGIDIVTVGVGRIVGSRFSFPPEGQQELVSSLSRLKGDSRFSSTLWFGFGVKHIVRSLIETEQGAMCVSLCASLALLNEKPDSFDSGKILRELCSESGAPSALTPSIHQWAKLVDVCAGSLQKSHLPLDYDGFYRLLAWRPSRGQPVSTHANLAKALSALADLSKGTMAYALFVGAGECAWLAAVARRLLQLVVEIRDEDGNIIYRSHDDRDTQACFQRLGPKYNETRDGYHHTKAVANGPLKHAHFVSTHATLIQLASSETISPRYPPGRWSTLLSDAFKNWADVEEQSAAVSSFLTDFALLPERGLPASVAPPRLAHTALRLAELSPEFVQCVDTARIRKQGLVNPNSPQYVRFRPCGRCCMWLNPESKPLVKEATRCLCDLETLCACSNTYVERTEYATGKCLSSTVWSLAKLLVLLSFVENLDDDLPPSVRSLQSPSIPNYCSWNGGWTASKSSLVVLVLDLFCSGPIKYINDSAAFLAVRSHSIVAFDPALIDPYRFQEEGTENLFSVLSGDIGYDGRRYQMITDIGNPHFPPDFLHPGTDRQLEDPETGLVWQLIVAEARDSTELMAGYRAKICDSGRYRYYRFSPQIRHSTTEDID